jgi:hypothetical protein
MQLYWILFALFYSVGSVDAGCPIKTPAPKLCVNCKYFKTTGNSDKKFGYCTRLPEQSGLNYQLVDDTADVQYIRCVLARSQCYLCGEEAKYFVRKYRKKPKPDSLPLSPPQSPPLSHATPF